MVNKAIAYTIAGALLVGSLPACNSEHHDQSAEVEGTGDLRLPLEATAASGNVYRLRAAQFNISGPENTLVSPPDDASTSFTTELDSGLYSVELLSGWQLWRMGPTEQLVEAELVSPNPITAAVLPDAETVVTFQFRAGSDIVVLGPGDLTVEIAVEEETPCSSDADCAAGEVCESGLCVVVGLCGDGVVHPGEQCDDGNTVDGDGCSASCTTEAPLVSHLVINEVDYDQSATDSSEFVEIYNGTGSPVSLGNLALFFINGTTATDYSQVNLAAAGAELASGQYLVAGSGELLSAVPGGTLTFTFPLATNNIQNGEPDGLALVDLSTGELIDALSYEGSVGPVNIFGVASGLLLGDPALAKDDGVTNASLVRVPNGIDTDTADDWIGSSTSTPGAPN